MDQAISQVVAAAAEQVERAVDEKLNELDNLDEDELAQLRRKKMENLRKKAQRKDEWQREGRGSYAECADEKEFFAQAKGADRVICHTFSSQSKNCEIVDKHLREISAKHLEAVFVKLNAEKSPFICQKLNVWMMPTIIVMKDNKLVDKIEGFDSLGGTNEFPTEFLEWRLGQTGAIDYDGEFDPEIFLNGRKSLHRVEKIGKQRN